MFLLGTNAAVADDYVYEIELKRHEGGTFYVHTRLAGGADTELLLDTGSSYVALTRKTFRSLKSAGPVAHLRDIKGETAAGRRVAVSVYRVDALDIGSGCVLRNVEVAVVPGATRDILGISALKQLGSFSISMDPPRLRFSNCAEPPTLVASLEE